MTNAQKAIDIAQWDGWILPTPFSTFYQNGYRHLKGYELTKLYLTDLNYLVPVAVKVYRDLPATTNLWDELHQKFVMVEKDSKGTYQPLFDAVYDAIVYFEEQAK